MAYCPNCGREGNNFCSYCGAKLYEEAPASKESALSSPNIFLIVLSALCFIIGLVIYGFFCGKPEGKVYLKYACVSALVYIAVFTALIAFPIGL
ncbi:MAG TPA: hypothetical protein VIL24_05425 [Clostridia bacterium]